MWGRPVLTVSISNHDSINHNGRNSSCRRVHAYAKVRSLVPLCALGALPCGNLWLYFFLFIFFLIISFLTEMRCFDYCTLHSWALFCPTLLLSFPATAKGHWRDHSVCPAAVTWGFMCLSLLLWWLSYLLMCLDCCMAFQDFSVWRNLLLQGTGVCTGMTCRAVIQHLGWGENRTSPDHLSSA